MNSLEEGLYSYGMSDFYPFHMPGHKRQGFCGLEELPNEIKNLFQQIFRMDITEIPGFDNLHHPEGVIKALMEEMREFYQTRETYLLVNGSTAGILASLSACTDIGDAIAVARNCHKSVLNAAFLRNLDVHYILPEIIEEYGIHGGVSPAKVDILLRNNPHIKAVLIVSPTYEGVVSDVGEIGRIVHSYNIPLIVDEAHGAHFSYRTDDSVFPRSALQYGADIVIQSLHKTLPSMTQTALLHVNGKGVKKEAIEQYLGIYQTSSPSYILMASVSMCFHFMKNEGRRKMREYEKNIIALRNRLVQLKLIEILGKNLVGKYGIFDYDIGKLVFIPERMNCTGKWLMERLREDYHLEMEMSAVSYVVGMTSVMDRTDGYERLLHGLQRLENSSCNEKKADTLKAHRRSFENKIPLQKITSTEAFSKRGVYKEFRECLAHISKETLYVYPPGQAFLVAGEVIDRNILEQIAWYQENGFEISGLTKAGRIYVVDQ